MEAIDNGVVVCVSDNEWGNFTVGKQYLVENESIEDDDGHVIINFTNVRKRFKLA